MSYFTKLFRLGTNLFSTKLFGKPLLIFLAKFSMHFPWVLGIRANASTPYLYIPTLLPYLTIFLPHYFTVFFIPDSLYLFALYYTALSCLYISFIHSLYFTYYILYALLYVSIFISFLPFIYIILPLILFFLPLVTLDFGLHTPAPLSSCFINTAKNFNGHKFM